MLQKRTADDWTPEAIRRFWDWYSPRPETQKRYFSRQVGRALTRVLQLSGGLKGRVLDFGCGPGYLLQRMCERSGVTCEGVDFSPRSIEETRKRLEGVKNFAGAQAIDKLPTPLAAARFDGLTCIETVEHLTDSQLNELLGEVLRVLKPGGIALFSTPFNEDLERSQNYCPFCESEFHNMQHLRSFEPAELHDTLTASGFDVLFCEGLDLWRFQKGKGRKLVDYSMRDVFGSIARGFVKTGAALGDALSSRAFPDKRAFRSRVRLGPHLIAMARKPAERG